MVQILKKWWAWIVASWRRAVPVNVAAHSQGPYRTPGRESVEAPDNETPANDWRAGSYAQMAKPVGSRKEDPTAINRYVQIRAAIKDVLPKDESWTVLEPFPQRWEDDRKWSFRVIKGGESWGFTIEDAHISYTPRPYNVIYRMADKIKRGLCAGCGYQLDADRSLVCRGCVPKVTLATPRPIKIVST